MATSNTKTKTEAKSNTRGSNVVSIITQDMIRKDFKAVLTLEGKTWQAKAKLRRDALQFTIKDTATVIEWSRRWNDLKSKATGKAASNAREAAKTYFQLWFAIETSSDSKSAIARAATAATRSALEIVQECVAVHSLSDKKTNFGDGFDFASDGTTHIKRGTPLADNMWAHMEYDKVDDLKGDEYAKRNPTFRVVDTSNQRFPGHVAWSDIRAMLLDKTGQDRTGSAAAKDKKLDAGNPMEGFAFYANTAKANAAVYDKMESKAATLRDLSAVLAVVFNSPVFAPGWEHVTKGFDMWRSLLGVKSAPVSAPSTSLADAKGADVLKLFQRSKDLTTPESAKTLPHPNGEKAKADAKAARAKTK